MVVAEPLYGFYNTEISLHFLHALVRCAAYSTLHNILTVVFVRCFFLFGYRELR